MATYAIVNSNTNIVENHIEWDGITEYEPPEGTILIEVVNQMVDFGYTWNGSTFIAPEPTPKPQPTLAELQAQLATITAHIQALANT
jgi:hypothetical protein